MKKLYFDLDDHDATTLQAMSEQGGYADVGEMVRDALQLLWALQQAATNGYTEICARNPVTNEAVRVSKQPPDGETTPESETT